MPYIGLGLHVLVALFFAIHVIRSGQQIFWIFILFSFPLLGSVVYFIAVYLPDSRLPGNAKKAVTAVARTLDPERELRAARAAFEFTPTAQNQMRFALALLESGAADEAASNYEACLKGPFAADLEIKYCAARAFVESGRYEPAITHLQAVRNSDAYFREEQVSILLARALAGANRQQEAKAEFESALSRFGSFEARAEYAIWAMTTGDSITAQKLQPELDQTMQRWDKRMRELNKHLLKRLDNAIAKKPSKTGAQ